MDLKKLFLTLYTISLASIATAGGFMPAPVCTNQPATVPCEHSAWEVGVTAYWLHPANAELTNYIYDDINNNSHSLYPPHHSKFSLGLEGSYHWGKGNSLTLAWQRYNKSMSNTSTDNDPNDQEYFYVNNDYDLNVLTLDLGQHLVVSPSWIVDASFGGEYVKFEQSITALNDDEPIVPTSFINPNFESSKFRGLGPRTGLSVQYNLGHGFGLVGRSHAALLVGHLKNVGGYPIPRLLNNLVAIQALSTSTLGERHAVVAAVDAKLGFNYQRNLSQGSLILEGGYGVSKFTNMVQFQGNAVSSYSGQTQAFSLDGWYATFKYVS